MTSIFPKLLNQSSSWLYPGVVVGNLLVPRSAPRWSSAAA